MLFQALADRVCHHSVTRRIVVLVSEYELVQTPASELALRALVLHRKKVLQDPHKEPSSSGCIFGNVINLDNLLSRQALIFFLLFKAVSYILRKIGHSDRKSTRLNSS